ncbi:MAG: WYL domain-containing protein [Desulfobulbaceae bacterium]|nr:WYL domain-containing protein [Desulfobulbaceae bacterium]
MSVLERVFYFHREILKGKYPNSRTLADHFEMSTATSKRDITYLRDRLCAPLAFNPKKNGFYYQDGFHLPFEESPRIIFLLAMLSKLADEAGLGELQEVRQLEQRLSTMVSPDYGNVIDSLHCLWIEIESIDHRIFEIIIEAVVKKQLLTLEYRTIGGEANTRTVAPLQIINYQGGWYFYAFCYLRQENRLFHIGRVQRAEIDNRSIPEDISLDRSMLGLSFGIFQGQPRYMAEILFTSTAAELVKNQRWHKDQETEAVEKGVLLRLPVSDDRELIMKILQYGAMAQVLSPPELIKRLQTEIIAMAENYRSMENSYN